MHDRGGAKWTRRFDHLHGDLSKHLAAPSRDCGVRRFSGHKGLDADRRPQAAQSFNVLPRYIVLDTPEDALAKPHLPEGSANFRFAAEKHDVIAAPTAIQFQD